MTASRSESDAKSTGFGRKSAPALRAARDQIVEVVVRRRRAVAGRGVNFAGIAERKARPGGLTLERVLLLEGARGFDARSHDLRSHCLRDRFLRGSFERAS